MKLATHIAAGAATYVAVAGIDPYVLAAAIAAQGPDIDINFMHRGPIHSLLAGAVVTAGAWIFNPALGLAVGCGWFSHILLDCLTPSGVELLWPWRHKVKLPLTKTGGPGDHAIKWLSMVFLLVMVTQWIMESGGLL